MFHPSSFLVVIGLFAFLGAIALAFLVAYRSASFVECAFCALLGAVATLSLLSALPGGIVAVRDPETSGELIVYGPPLTRWVTPEAALGDSNELFFERVAVVPDQPTAGPRQGGENAPPRQKPAPVSGKPYACMLVGLTVGLLASVTALATASRNPCPGKPFRRRRIRLLVAVAALGLGLAIFGLATS